MNNIFSRTLLRFFLLLVLCLCCSCQAAKSTSSSASVTPPKATTESERLGDSLMETGRIDQAVAEYDRALDAGADKASIAYRKGFAYFNQGQWKKALDLFQEAISTNPGLTIAYEGAGISSFQLGHFNQASDYFIDVMERAPKHWVSYAFMAGILAAEKNTRGSREMHRKAMEVAGKDKFRQVNSLLSETYKRGEYLVRTGMYKPGKAEPRKLAAAPESHAAPRRESAGKDDAAEGNVYRSVKTMSPEEKEKIREQMLARLNKGQHNQAKPETGSEKSADAESKAASLNITPLGDAEVQALLRAHKTGQLNERLSDESVSQESAEPPAETLSAETNQAPPTGQESPQPVATQPEDNAAESFVANAQPLMTAPVMEPAASESSEYLRELPHSGYSAMESSFPEIGLAEERARTLQAKGLDPYVAPVHLGDRGTWYRVLFGPYDSKGKARAMRSRLAKEYGLTKAIVIKHTQH